MTLKEKLEYLREHYPEVLGAIKADVPNIVEDPEHPTSHDLDHYNFWIDAILDDDAQLLYHLVF